jgi:hypothetical protein
MKTYSINWMGPINTKWIKENGSHWAAGRIDVYGDEPYPDEIGLAPMHGEDWGRFGRWLDTLKTEDTWPLDRLVREYEKDNPPIRWWVSKGGCGND